MSLLTRLEAIEIIMSEIKFDDLLGSGAHFGHVTRKWNPNFKPYILLEKNGVHLPDTMVVEFQKPNSDRPRIVVYERRPGSKFKVVSQTPYSFNVKS